MDARENVAAIKKKMLDDQQKEIEENTPGKKQHTLSSTLSFILSLTYLSAQPPLPSLASSLCRRYE